MQPDLFEKRRVDTSEKMQKKKATNTRLRTEALGVKMQQKRCSLRSSRKGKKIPLNPKTNWVQRHAGGDGEIRTLELVSELHDFQSCALDRTRRHLRIVQAKTIITGCVKKIKCFLYY